METTNQNNLDEIISQDTEKINNDEQTKSEIVYIEVDKLHPHDANPRKNTGDVTELADSIKKTVYCKILRLFLQPVIGTVTIP